MRGVALEEALDELCLLRLGAEPPGFLRHQAVEIDQQGRSACDFRVLGRLCAIQYQADRIIYKMCEAHGNLYAVQKEILRRMYGLELGGVRAPLPNLIPEDEAVVAEAQKMIEEAIAKL